MQFYACGKPKNTALGFRWLDSCCWSNALFLCSFSFPSPTKRHLHSFFISSSSRLKLSRAPEYPSKPSNLQFPIPKSPSHRENSTPTAMPSPSPARGRSYSRSPRPAARDSRSRTRTPMQDSRSGSQSRELNNHGSNNRGRSYSRSRSGAPRSRSRTPRSVSRSRSRSRGYTRRPARRSYSRSLSRSRSRSRSYSRSRSPYARRPAGDRGGRHTSRSYSRSLSPAGPLGLPGGKSSKVCLSIAFHFPTNPNTNPTSFLDCYRETHEKHHCSTHY